jgi:hypothetical protein
MLKFTYKGSFLTIKKGIQKIVVLKIQMVNTCFGASSTYGDFLNKKTLKSIFGCISKFLKLIVFGQNLAKFGSFGVLGRFSCHGSG